MYFQTHNTSPPQAEISSRTLLWIQAVIMDPFVSTVAKKRDELYIRSLISLCDAPSLSLQVAIFQYVSTIRQQPILAHQRQG